MTLTDEKLNILKQNLGSVLSRIERAAVKAGGKPEDITLIAVTKTVGVDEINALYDLGVCEFGESRIQAAAAKIPLAKPGARWHLVGHLQTNKAKKALELFSVVHSVDSTHLAEELDKHSAAKGAKIPVFLEINVSGEETKYGAAESGALELAEFVRNRPALELKGLMTMAPYSDNPEDARPYFRQLREMRDDIAKRLGMELPWLSMGMTGDFEQAIEEGATHVRIGTALFIGL